MIVYCKKIIINFFVSIFALFCFLLAFEFFLFLTDWDIKILKPILFFEGANKDIGQASENVNRLYELKPGAILKRGDSFNEKEGKSSNEERVETINGLGFRGKERSPGKPEGIFRIFVLGGSNTYGALVGDDETYPAYMQKILGEKYPGRYEVWNGGLHGYVLSQEVAYAKEILEKYQPDLFIFQWGNVGRRGFEGSADFASYFKKNPELFLENLPFPYLENEKLIKVHNFLILHSRSYRFFVAGLNILNVKRLEIKIGQLTPNFQSAGELNYFQNPGDAISRRDFSAFLKEFSVPDSIFFINPFGRASCSDEINQWILSDVECFGISADGLPAEYSQVHPPSYVYKWTAENMVDYLEKKGYVGELKNQ